MADEHEAPSLKVLPLNAEFPGFNFPTVYVDSVSSIQPGTQTTKFYLARFEPHMQATNQLLNQPVVQVVMPTSGFVDTAAFFGRMVEQLIETGSITREQWDQAVESYKSVRPKP